ncbi:hypothetical protein D3C81_1476400 [compost metagenome]
MTNTRCNTRISPPIPEHNIERREVRRWKYNDIVVKSSFSDVRESIYSPFKSRHRCPGITRRCWLLSRQIRRTASRLDDGCPCQGSRRRIGGRELVYALLHVISCSHYPDLGGNGRGVGSCNEQLGLLICRRAGADPHLQIDRPAGRGNRRQILLLVRRKV